MLSATLASAAGAAGCSGVREAGASAGRDRRGVVPRWLDCLRFFAIDVTQSFSVVGTRCSYIERVVEDPLPQCCPPYVVPSIKRGIFSGRNTESKPIFSLDPHDRGRNLFNLNRTVGLEG